MKNNKMTFIWMIVGFIAISFILVLAKAISWEQALAGATTISGFVFGLYQWYSKEEVVKWNNELHEIILQQHDQLMELKGIK